MGTYRNIPDDGSPSWKEPVAFLGSLPATGNARGDARVVQSSNTIYVWNGTSWSTGGGGGSSDSFTTMQTDTGTSPVATSSTDTLTFTSPIIDVNGNSSTDTISLNTKPQYNAGNSGTSLAIDFSNGPAQLVTLTGNVTLSFSNPESGGAYVIKFDTGAGSFGVVFPASVLWPGGTPPTITTSPSSIDLINLYYDGTNYLGSFVQALA